MLHLATERPTKISAILRRLHQGETRNDQNQAWFEDLLQRTMPEHFSEILQLEDQWEQVLSFAAKFSLKYFPLQEAYLETIAEFQEEELDEDQPYSFLQKGIPIQLMGFNWEGLHDMWNVVGRGMSALAILTETPEIQLELAEFTGYVGMRQAWLESAADEIPEATLRRIPEGGIPLERLEAAVQGTPMAAAHLAGKWIWARTENFFLDESFPEDFDYEFTETWDDETIEYAAAEWERARAIVEQVEQLTAWLEEDLPARFEQLLDLILARLEAIPEKAKE